MANLGPIKILLVEDEENIALIEKKYFDREGYETTIAKDGEEALDYFYQEDFQFVILDLMLGKVSGEKVLEEIRKTSDVPVIIVSAKNAEIDRIENLRKGADDYIIKPFSPRELVERIKVILRRFGPKEASIETMDEKIKIHPDEMRVLKDEEEVHLTKNEFAILSTLFSNPKKVFTRDEIIGLAFGLDYDAYDRAIDTHIKNIRQKLEDDPKNPKYIITIYGVGYRAGGFE